MENNLRTYNSRQVVNWYAQLNTITEVERVVFDKFAGLIKSGRLLDIGFGGGRTTQYLLNKTTNYTGIDYSAKFVGVVKQLYPQAIVSVMDARELKFTDDSFEFINFSFNGIDYSDLIGRTKIFSEIYRTLKPGGIFFFSTHNKKHKSFNVSPWLDKSLTLTTRIKNFVKFFPFQFKKLTNRRWEIYTEDYAIINDSAHNYSLMTFYTSPRFLRQQLLEQNFTEIVFYNKAGFETNDDGLDDWIFVTCKKPRI